MVWKVLTGGDFTDFPLDPIGAGSGGGVGEEAAIR